MCIRARVVSFGGSIDARRWRVRWCGCRCRYGCVCVRVDVHVCMTGRELVVRDGRGVDSVFG